MYTTAVILNAGLGDLSLGLKIADFDIIAAYEADQKAAAVHKANIDAPIVPHLPEGSGLKTVAAADLLVARLYSPELSSPHSKSSLRKERKDNSVTADDFLKLLESCRPKAFLLVLGAAYAKGRQTEPLLAGIVERNFRWSSHLIDTAEAVGMPITERKIFIVGTRSDNSYEGFDFAKFQYPVPLPLENFLQADEQIDPWYFAGLNPGSTPIDRSGKRVYCWKGGCYTGTDRVQWNHWKVPLVDTGGTFRKITHREIANLKGFPAAYALPAHKNRAWLYQKLMYAVNVTIVEKLAKGLSCSLADSPRRSRPISAAARFEDLFNRYLSELADENGTGEVFLTREVPVRDYFFDFMLRLPHQTLFFELKSYRDRQIPLSSVRRICKQFEPPPEDGKLILVLANEVSADTKRECQELFHISIWDVGNLLWLFGKFEEIKNEFIALLDYTTRDIEPVPPEFDIDFSIPEKETEDQSSPAFWKKQLARIEPGREQCQEYEEFCVKILKYILDDYLSLWAVQNQTGDGLHRFDLCCKIKNGATHDFFNTLTQYFNTKYIVFEFKNYSGEIGQKEIYTTEKYLYATALRKVAVIISRYGSDDHALQAAKGSLRENGKLILSLSDDNLLKMVDLKSQGDHETPDFLSDMLDDLLLHLEK